MHTCQTHSPSRQAKQHRPMCGQCTLNTGNYAVALAMSIFFYAVRLRLAPLHLLSAIHVIRHFFGIPLVLGLRFTLGITNNNNA